MAAPEACRPPGASRRMPKSISISGWAPPMAVTGVYPVGNPRGCLICIGSPPAAAQGLPALQLGHLQDELAGADLLDHYGHLIAHARRHVVDVQRIIIGEVHVTVLGAHDLRLAPGERALDG